MHHHLAATANRMARRFLVDLMSFALSAMACVANAQTMDGPMMDHSKMDHSAHMAMMAEASGNPRLPRHGWPCCLESSQTGTNRHRLQGRQGRCPICAATAIH
jgi:hypothetical protein